MPLLHPWPGRRLQFEGPLDPTLIQTEFFVHDKVQMDLTGQLSPSFKNLGNQAFFFKQDFYNTATTVYWNRFFQPVAFNFPMGKPPLRPQRPAVCSEEDFTEAGNRPPIFRYRCVLQQWHRPSAPISDIEKISTMSRERHEMVGCPKNTSYSRFWYEKNKFTHANPWEGYFLKDLCRKKSSFLDWWS